MRGNGNTRGRVWRSWLAAPSVAASALHHVRVQAVRNGDACNRSARPVTSLKNLCLEGLAVLAPRGPLRRTIRTHG